MRLARFPQCPTTQSMRAPELQPHNRAYRRLQRAQIRLFPRGFRRRTRPVTARSELLDENRHRYGPDEHHLVGLYLCSLQGILGTSRPRHYNMLLDENGVTCVHPTPHLLFFADCLCGLQNRWNRDALARTLPHICAPRALHLRPDLLPRQELFPTAPNVVENWTGVADWILICVSFQSATSQGSSSSDLRSQTGLFSSTVAPFITNSYPPLQQHPHTTGQSLVPLISQQLSDTSSNDTSRILNTYIGSSGLRFL